MTSLVIVARDRPELFDELATRFAREPSIYVMFDRRGSTAPPPGVERRQDEGSANAGLWVQGYIIVPTR